jgi:uncharacterized protein (TIGR03437 family)
MRMTMRVSICSLLWAGCALNGQTVSSVVNAASLDTRLSPGALAMIRGTNLGTGTSTPVTVAGKAAAVQFASPTQFTVQIPFDAPVGTATLQIGNSAPFNITLTQYAPALFASNSMGFGNLAGTHPDGSPIDDNDPATPGETISLFATGLGPTIPPLATGAPGPAQPPAATAVQPVVLYASETATAISSVMAPGQVGVYQITIRLTPAPVTGIRAIGLTIGGASSGFGVSIPIAAAFVKPVISRVLSATGIPGSIQDTIQSGSWVAIYGTDFSVITRDWTDAITGGRLPTALSGVKVTIDGKPAAVYFISPTQINVQAPNATVGTVQVVVTNTGQVSDPATAQVRTYAPAFFQWGASKYAVTTRYPDNAYIGGPSLGQQWLAAKPGDTLILWATGFGPTNPQVPPGITVSTAAFTTAPVTVVIGGVNAPVLGAALSAGLAGVYQVAIQIPPGITAGDARIQATIAGFSSPDNVYIYVSPN